MPQDLINPARVDFVTLRLFCAVAQSGSITQGARHCHLALSAASRRLSDFEAAAARAAARTQRAGVVLTAAGRLALQHAARLFQGFELFSNELSEHASGARGHVRLWANMSALVQFLPATLADFMARSPGTRVEVEEQLSGDIARAVQDGLADRHLRRRRARRGLDLTPFAATGWWWWRRRTMRWPRATSPISGAAWPMTSSA